MSELTKCNYCNLQDMKWRAEERKVEVNVRPGLGGWSGWTVAQYSDHDEPSAYFMELTNRCVCG